MQKPARNDVLAALTICVLLLRPSSGTAELVPVRHTEGLSHGFLVLRTLEGKAIAGQALPGGAFPRNWGWQVEASGHNVQGTVL